MNPPPLSSRQGSNGQYSPSLCISSPGGWTSNWGCEKPSMLKISWSNCNTSPTSIFPENKGVKFFPFQKATFLEGLRDPWKRWDFNRPPLLLRPPSPDIFPPNPSTHPGSTTLAFSKKKHRAAVDLAKIPIFFQKWTTSPYISGKTSQGLKIHWQKIHQNMHRSP